MDSENPKTSRSLITTLAIAFAALSVAVLLIAGRLQLIALGAANMVTSFIQEKFSIIEAAVRLGSPASASRKDQKWDDGKSYYLQNCRHSGAQG